MLVMMLMLVLRAPAMIIVHEDYGERRKEVQYCCHACLGARRVRVTLLHMCDKPMNLIFSDRPPVASSANLSQVTIPHPPRPMYHVSPSKTQTYPHCRF